MSLLQHPSTPSSPAWRRPSGRTRRAATRWRRRAGPSRRRPRTHLCPRRASRTGSSTPSRRRSARRISQKIPRRTEDVAAAVVVDARHVERVEAMSFNTTCDASMPWTLCDDSPSARTPGCACSVRAVLEHSVYVEHVQRAAARVSSRVVECERSSWVACAEDGAVRLQLVFAIHAVSSSHSSAPSNVIMSHTERNASPINLLAF